MMRHLVPDDDPRPPRRRTYDSPLRERQAQQTRDAILDALTALLEERPADLITTRELALAAGVAERTVYRHFPDRSALVEGLTARLYAVSGVEETELRGLDDLHRLARELMRNLDAHHVEARAEALYNADPRRYTTATAEHTRQLHALVASLFPRLDERQQHELTAVLRILISAQTWLRLREEFDLRSAAAGPLIVWAINALVHEIERGEPPP